MLTDWIAGNKNKIKFKKPRDCNLNIKRKVATSRNTVSGKKKNWGLNKRLSEKKVKMFTTNTLWQSLAFEKLTTRRFTFKLFITCEG